MLLVVVGSPSRTKEFANLHCTPTTPRIAPAAQLASLGGYPNYDFFNFLISSLRYAALSNSRLSAASSISFVSSAIKV